MHIFLHVPQGHPMCLLWRMLVLVTCNAPTSLHAHHSAVSQLCLL
jgi:hypothetical protein